jgi:hypothetical protein
VKLKEPIVAAATKAVDAGVASVITLAAPVTVTAAYVASFAVPEATRLAAAVSAELAGTETNVAVSVAVVAAVASFAAIAAVTGIVIAVPTIGTAGVAVPCVIVQAVAAACAGTTDVSPNPSEATAITATFFNEIVFTIFLSFSRFQAFPGLGWWLKRPPH